MEGTPVYAARKSIGAQLARESHVDADVIVPVPDSGVPAAMGYSIESRIPFELGHHPEPLRPAAPSSSRRTPSAILGVKLKHSANRSALEGKRVVLVDDSIVRGTTSRKIVEMVRAAGAAEVHMRISSPPTTNSCFYGIDTPERGKLLAARHSIDEMAAPDRRRQPGLHLSRRALPRARQARPRHRQALSSATPASPANTPSTLRRHDRQNADRQLSLLTEA